ncbi:hypothetical protein N7540_012521 [Penicillium herquei]|nr:hypothetical protein N7540_012521 [Penicillium herquei]
MDSKIKPASHYSLQHGVSDMDVLRVEASDALSTAQQGSNASLDLVDKIDASDTESLCSDNFGKWIEHFNNAQKVPTIYRTEADIIPICDKGKNSLSKDQELEKGNVPLCPSIDGSGKSRAQSDGDAHICSSNINENKSSPP